ncbi:MAG: esterase-like activity of phytase family protein [Geminicoccaceae bacterium]|nr:esterase-like activity of phytase family protein [Geminicoccaceae bacterium]
MAGLAIALLAGPPACAELAGDPGGTPVVRATPLDTEELASAARLHPGARLGPAWRLESADPRFGGFSGLVVERDRILLLSDRGWLWSVERAPRGTVPFRDGSWRVSRLRVDGRVPDAEDLARSPDGQIVVAFEGRHAIARASGGELEDRPVLDFEARSLPDPLSGLPGNLGTEALAALSAGALLAIAEHGTGQRHMAALLGPGGPRLLAYRSAPGFAPTGADHREGWLYVVERKLSAFSGFAARLTATPIDDPADLPDLLEPTLELARWSGPGAVDNMEGVASEPIGPNGTVRLWLVSDDNFSPLQRTLLMTVEWAPQALARASIRRFSRTSSEGSSDSDTERK